MTKNFSEIQQRRWWKWPLTVGLFALVLTAGSGVRRSDYFSRLINWVYWPAAGELFVAGALCVCLCLTKTSRLRICLFVGLTVQAFTLGTEISPMAQRNSQARARDSFLVQDTSLGMNPEAHRRLPPLQDVLYDGAWASEDTLRFLERCRKQYPLESRYIDTYIAAFYFWHDDAERGDRALSRLGLQPELVNHYERRSRWDKIEQMTRDPQNHSTAQVSAWWALARRAERESNSSGADLYYLQALEHCQSDPSGADLQKTIWQTVRARLGKTISREQYVASLNTWAERVSDQALLKSIAFELGKLQLLDKLQGKLEVRP